MTDLAPVADPAPVALYRNAVAQATTGATDAETFEFSLAPLDVTGIPVWSVTVASEESRASGIGYGETDGRARTGAWGELTEGVFVGALPGRTIRESSFRALESAGEAAVDPLSLRLPLGTDYTPDTPRLWTPARRVAPGTDRDGEPVWVLVEEAAAHHSDLPAGYAPLYTPLTNGLGAGDTRARAVAHGILELAQRDATSVGYRSLDRGVVIDLRTVGDAGCRTLISQYEAAGITLMAKLAETPLGVPVVYVVGRERDLDRLPHPLALTGCGEGAHPDRTEALRKALLEFAASRVRKLFCHGPLDAALAVAPEGYRRLVRRLDAGVEEGRSFEAVRDWAGLSAETQLAQLAGTWFRETETIPFESLPTSDAATPEATVALLAARAVEAGLDVFAVDLTPDGAGVAVVKTVVPGMEVETLTYGRIGPRNVGRLLARIAAGDALVHPDLVGIGRPPAGAQAIPLGAAGEAALGGPAWLDADLLAETLGPLYAMYREPPRHAIGLAAERATAERDAARRAR